MVCLFVGAALFTATQHIPYTTGLYWAVTTATTVGYGDVTPKNPSGRLVATLTMLTTIPLFASAFAVFAGAVASTHLRRLFGMVKPEPTSDDVVIFGFNPAVPRIARELTEGGRGVVAVAKCDRSTLPDAVRLIDADPTSEEAVVKSHPEHAGHLLVTGATDADVLVTSVLVRRAAPAVPTLAAADGPSVCGALCELGVPTAVSAEDLLVHTLAKSLEAPHAGELLLRLVDSDGYQLKELPVGDGQAGRPLSDVRAERDGLVLGIVQADRVHVGVAEDPVLHEGDRLIVLEADARRGPRRENGHN